MRKLSLIALVGLAVGLVAAAPASAATIVADCTTCGLAYCPDALGTGPLDTALAAAVDGDTILIKGICNRTTGSFRVNKRIELTASQGGGIQRLNGSCVELLGTASGSRIHHLTVIDGGFTCIRNRVIGVNVTIHAPDDIEIDHNNLISDSALGGNNVFFASGPRGISQSSRNGIPANDAGECAYAGQSVGIMNNWHIHHNDIFTTTSTPGDSAALGMLVGGNNETIEHNRMNVHGFAGIFTQTLANCANAPGQAAFVPMTRGLIIRHNKIDVDNQPPDPSIDLSDRYPVGIVTLGGCPPTQAAYPPDLACDSPKDMIVEHNCVRTHDNGALTCDEPNDPDANCPLPLTCGGGTFAKGTAIAYISQFNAGETTEHNQWTMPLSSAARPIPACTFSAGNIGLQSVGSNNMTVRFNHIEGAGIAVFNTDGSESGNFWSKNLIKLGGASGEALGTPYAIFDPGPGPNVYTGNTSCDQYAFFPPGLANANAQNSGFCHASQAPCDLSDVGPGGVGALALRDNLVAAVNRGRPTSAFAAMKNPRRTVGHRFEGKAILGELWGPDLQDALTPGPGDDGYVAPVTKATGAAVSGARRR